MSHVEETGLRAVAIAGEIAVGRGQVTPEVLGACHVTGIVVDVNVELHLIDVRTIGGSDIVHFLLGGQEHTGRLLVVLGNRKVAGTNFDVGIQIIE